MKLHQQKRILSSFTSVFIQCYEFYGMTSAVGKFGGGTIFKTDGNGNYLQVVFNFPIDIPSWGEGYLMQADNGKLY